jgi:hypothetical protein
VTPEPLAVFLLRIAILLAFAVGMAAMSPKLGFVLSHPGLLYPPGLHDQWRVAAQPGVVFYRQGGQMMSAVRGVVRSAPGTTDRQWN